MKKQSHKDSLLSHDDKKDLKSAKDLKDLKEQKKVKNLSKEKKQKSGKSDKKEEVEKIDILAQYHQKIKTLSPGWYQVLSHNNEALYTLLKSTGTPKDENHVSPVVKENNGVLSILCLALRFQNYEAAELLLVYGADKTYKNSAEQDCVHFASNSLLTENEFETMKNWLTINGFEGIERLQMTSGKDQFVSKNGGMK